MGNKQSAPSRRKSCPGRAQTGLDATKITVYPPRRTTITHGPVAAGVSVRPASTAGASSAPHQTPIWDLLGLSVPQGPEPPGRPQSQIGRSLTPDSDDEPEQATETSLTSEELDQIALDRQFAILLQIQADFAKAQRQKREEKEEQLLKSALDLSMTDEIQAGPSQSDSPPKEEASGPEDMEEVVTDPDTTLSGISGAIAESGMCEEEEDEKVCSICLEELTPGLAPVTALLCYHVYHVTCINSWRAKGSIECPLCGADTL